ncbi:MAG: pentapeptide repeat-containing protein [Mycolicibacterium rufum]|nr:pentapeptide repeat-containing protein [Mycolicibacterium rufum]
MSLVRLVAIGTVVVTLVGFALFAWLAWLLSHQPAPLRGGRGFADWLGYVDGSKLFDAARTTATILAVVGVGGAALVAYRRQDTTERSHALTIEAQETAVKQFQLDSNKYQLDRERHVLEMSRRTDDRERELRSRFTTIAQQLGSTNYAERHAGAYALASLADDWHNFANDAERQVCVDLLCAQLRSPRPQEPARLASEDVPKLVAARDNYAQDTEVRKTMVALLCAHRSLTSNEASTWRSCSIDLSGADLSGFNFVEIDLSTANLNRANLTGTDFHKSNLSNAQLMQTDLSAAKFTEANLSSAKLVNCRTKLSNDSDIWGMRVSFEKAILHKAWFTSATLQNADFSEADLTDAVLHSAKLAESDFSYAILRNTSLIDAHLDRATFKAADLRRTNFAKAETHEADFDDAKFTSRTIWRHGQVPPRARRVADD